MKALRPSFQPRSFLLASLALFTFIGIGCNGGDLGASPTDAIEDMAGMDMFVPSDTATGTTTGEVGPTDTADDMAGMDMNEHDTTPADTTPVDTSMAGMEM